MSLRNKIRIGILDNRKSVLTKKNIHKFEEQHRISSSCKSVGKLIPDVDTLELAKQGSELMKESDFSIAKSLSTPTNVPKLQKEFGHLYRK